MLCWRFLTPSSADARRSGAVDNVEHEARHDVLAFTSSPLHKEVEVIGAVCVENDTRAGQGRTA